MYESRYLRQARPKAAFVDLPRKMRLLLPHRCFPLFSQCSIPAFPLSIGIAQKIRILLSDFHRSAYRFHYIGMLKNNLIPLADTFKATKDRGKDKMLFYDCDLNVGMI